MYSKHNALKEALARRKMHGHSSDSASQDVTNEQDERAQDLAPSVKDGHKKIAIDIKVGAHPVEGSPEEEAMESPAEEAAEQAGPPNMKTLMGHDLQPHEIDRLHSIEKPRSLLEAAQKALLKKRG